MTARRSRQYEHLALKVAAAIMMAVLFVGIIISIAGMASYLPRMLNYSSLEKTLQQFVADLLYILVLMELMALVSQYFTEARVKLEYALDAAIVFIVREILIYVYSESFVALNVVTLASFLAILMASRIVLAKCSAMREDGTG
ncbi:MAG: phosphate-starvation-inducible PsiE family protein [Conexivisphaera sp.]